MKYRSTEDRDPAMYCIQRYESMVRHPVGGSWSSDSSSCTCAIFTIAPTAARKRLCWLPGNGVMKSWRNIDRYGNDLAIAERAKQLEEVTGIFVGNAPRNIVEALLLQMKKR